MSLQPIINKYGRELFVIHFITLALTTYTEIKLCLPLNADHQNFY
jgi:hypothetical protein